MLLLGHCFGVNLLGCLEEGPVWIVFKRLSLFSHHPEGQQSEMSISGAVCSCKVLQGLSHPFLSNFDELQLSLIFFLNVQIHCSDICLCLHYACFSCYSTFCFPHSKCQSSFHPRHIQPCVIVSCYPYLASEKTLFQWSPSWRHSLLPLGG